MSTRAQVQGAFTETFRRYVRGPEQGADVSDISVADALHDAEERVMAVLPPEQRERELQPGPDTCPTCGMPGYLVPGRGDNPDAFIPDDMPRYASERIADDNGDEMEHGAPG